MSHKIYRICLFMMVIAAVIGGIFYFVKLQKNRSEIPKEAVFVMAEPGGEMQSKMEDAPETEGVSGMETNNNPESW